MNGYANQVPTYQNSGESRTSTFYLGQFWLTGYINYISCLKILMAADFVQSGSYPKQFLKSPVHNRRTAAVPGKFI